MGQFQVFSSVDVLVASAASSERPQQHYFSSPNLSQSIPITGTILLSYYPETALETYICHLVQDAIGQYDTIMQCNPDHQTGFNLVLCYYALEDGLSMKKAFQRLTAIPVQVEIA